MGHIGVWAGLYAIGAAICLYQLSGVSSAFLPRWEAVVAVFATATAVYSLDRVKIRDSWMDPADIAAQPERYHFLTRHSRSVRGFALALLISAGLIGLRVHRLAPIAPVLAGVAIIVYAPRPRASKARVKDLAWLKSSYIALGMTAYLAMVVLALRGADSLRSGVPAVLIAAAFVAARIALDAVLCDIDDVPTDRAFETETVATLLGRSRAWNYTGLVRVGLILAVLVVPTFPWATRLAWALAMVAGTVVLRVPRWDRLRDPVDVRFLVEAALATGILRMLAGHA